MSSSSSSDQPRTRWIKKGNKLVPCSTPVEKYKAPRHISVSTIDTNSSPSLISRRPPRQPAKVENKQKPGKATKEKKPRKATREKNPAKTTKEQKPAKKKTKARKNVKETRPKNVADSDIDWVTTLEQTDDEKENLQQSVRSSTKGIALFYDTVAPEVIREPQHFHDYHIDSPVRQPRKHAASPITIDLGDDEKSLPVKDLPHLQTYFDSSDGEEHELVLNPQSSDDPHCWKMLVNGGKSDQPRCYPNVRERREKKREISIDKTKRWLVNLTVPTVTADRLWDEYVRTHPEEMREWVAPLAKSPEESSSSKIFSNKKQNEGGKDKAANGNVENWATKKLWFSQYVLPDRSRIRGYRDRTSEQWFRKWIDSYDFPEPNDSDFGRSKTGVPKMRLNKYHEKCKKDLDLQAAGPSCSEKQRITKQNPKHAKTGQKEKLQTRKPVAANLLSDSSPDSETSKMALARPLAAELQKFYNLRSYAARLKAKEQEMMSKNATKDSNEKSLVPAKRKTRKRANELDRDDSKRAKMVVEGRPSITSDRLLVHKKYIKEKDHWRIV